MRDLGKRTFNRLLNKGATPAAQLLRLRAAPGDLAILGKGLSFKLYLSSFMHGFRDIKDWFGTGEGIRLQREDSDLALAVLQTMEEAGIVTLPIHDSFLVAEEHEAQLEAAMVDAFYSRYQVIPAIARKGPKPAPLFRLPRVHN
jgi:hypothetical protein